MLYTEYFTLRDCSRSQMLNLSLYFVRTIKKPNFGHCLRMYIPITTHSVYRSYFMHAGEST